MFSRLAAPILGLVCLLFFHNFLGYRTVLALFVTIFFHINGLWSCPVRSFCVRTFLPGNLWYAFSGVDLWFVGCLWRDDFLRFSACGKDNHALCTSWRVDGLVSWLCEGLKAFRVCLAFLGCFFFGRIRLNFRIFWFCIFT